MTSVGKGNLLMIGNKPLKENLSGFWKPSAVEKRTKQKRTKLKLNKY